MAVSVDRQHGKAEHLLALGAAPLAVDACNAHGHVAVLLNLPTYCLAGFPAGLKEVFSRDDAAPTLGPGLPEAGQFATVSLRAL